MRRPLALIAAGALALMLTRMDAAAEEVRVLSGEHNDFSRIVLIFGSAIKWTKEKSADGYQVNFDRNGLEMDLSEVYAKIPRDRFSEVSFETATSSFRVDTGCACTLEVFEVRPGVVAMDLRASDEPEPTTAEQTTAGHLSPSGIGMELGEVLRAEASNSVATGAWPLLAQKNERPSVDAFRVALQRQLEAASNTGLVDRSASTRPFSTAEEAVEDANPSAQLSPTTAYRHPQVRVSDAFTPAGKDREPHSRHETAECSDFDLEQLRLGPFDDPLRALISARAGIVDYSGAVDFQGVFGLYVAHLSLNQSTEARRLVNEWPDAFPDRQAATALVDVLDGSSSAYLSERSGCGTAAAFWGLLGAPDDAGGSIKNLPKVEAYFHSLSPQLQLALADRLSEKLNRKGAGASATAVERQAVLTAYSQGEIPPEEKGKPVAGGIATAAGTTLASTGHERGKVPATVAQSLKKALEKNGEIDRDLVELAQALATETRGLPVSGDLSASSILALIRNGQVDTAYDQYARISVGLPTGKLAKLQGDMVREILDIPDDARFLSVVFVRRPWSWVAELEPELHNALRERAAGLGISISAIGDLGLGRSDAVSATRGPAGLAKESDTTAANLHETESADHEPHEIASLQNPVEVPGSDAAGAFSQPQPIETPASDTTAREPSNGVDLTDSTSNAAVPVTVPIVSAGLQESERLLQSSRESRARINALLGRQ